ncbi:DUF58 domain-containing protein [Sulfurovum sp. XGS-02]|uniref:DUF58 domain-containing protein n=1 Tax=Sulfurovum sp. XGS-02 TaxID=2925411 RepID=UPI00205F18AF|nr:DUF58 domain-containing protein [Sulfurovum sp. XGS-02]UPT76556.1 DUF58 domain-containing protein [Sulfurovum sp. XGS-02]
MKSLRTFAQIYKRIDQHATRYSAVVVVLLFGLFLEAYMHDFNLVYITLFFVFSLAFSAGPIGILNLGHLKASYVRSGRLFAHQEGHLSMQINNDSATTSWSVMLRHEDTSIPLGPIKGDASTIVQLPVLPEKRGSFTHTGCYLESKYPLSTVRLVMKIDDSYQGMVYPQPKGISLHDFLQQEENHYGEEKEFDGLRTYDGSQKLSHIHWASVAKGEMSVKVFSKETRTPKLVFNFYTAATNDESRLSQLCLWVLECEKQNLPFMIQMPSRVLNSAKESTDVILETLARY